RAYTVVFRNNNCESAQAVFQDRKAFLYMVFSVHTKFCSTSSGSNYNSLVCAGFYQCCSFDHCVSRSSTETSCVRSCCIYQSGDLCSSLCEVAAASLVHVTAGFLCTVDHILNLCFVDAGVAYSIEKCQYAGSLAHQVLMHNESYHVHVDIVCMFYSSYQLIVEVQAFCILFIYEVLDLADH